MDQPPLSPDLPVGELPGLGAARVKALERLEIHTVGDLLRHYPRRIEDRRQFDNFPTGPTDRAVCVCGIVVKTKTLRLRGRGTMFEATLQEPARHALSSLLTVRWFNAWFAQKTFVEGQRVVIYGKPKARGSGVVIDHPEFEIIESADDEEGLIHLGRLTPVYPTTEGLSQRVLRGLIYRTLARVDLAAMPDLLPRRLDPTPTGVALRGIHFPENDANEEAARRHFVLSEFFALQLIIGDRRASTLATPGESHCGPGKLMDRLHDGLPFGLTKAQWRTIGDIRGDLAAARPMNRLLQGDVGSGKTLVAASAMLLAVEAGYQAVLMAPTQVLAEQHFLVFKRWLDPLGLRLGLRTGNRKEDTPGADDLFSKQPPPSTAPRSDNEPDILIGTHALLHEKAPPPRLGLVVIDEQHKFGVRQRATLSAGRKIALDVLIMTATPIPRTLAITIYGDLDVSVLDELPAGRGKIITAVRTEDKVKDAAAFIRDHLTNGRQAYLVYPLIDEGDKPNVKTATVAAEQWRELLSGFRVELLHGRMKPEEKDAVMRAFRDGEVHALVSTTVIEVGVDVKNASIMLIENAERFGLAQLHQLRGRVGRGEHKSYCLLMIDPKAGDEAKAKLQTLVDSSDGFVVAEADLRLRGAGDILGTAQSGLPPLRLGDLVRDGELMRLAREAVRDIFEVDPELRKPEHAAYRELVKAGRKLSLAQTS